jgi:hypothetical protein
MTDARLPCHWLHDPAIEELSDRSWRTYTGSLMWSAEHGTDGRLPARALRLLHPDGADDAAAAELVAAGRWKRVQDGYQIPDWEAHQSLAADVARQRERNRRRQRAWREHQVSTDVTRDVTRDETRESLRQGEARRGEEERNHAGTNAHAPASDDANTCVDCGKTTTFALPGRDARPRCRTCHPIHMRSTA